LYIHITGPMTPNAIQMNASKQANASLRSRFDFLIVLMGVSSNAPDHRSRANDVRLSTEARSRRSVQPILFGQNLKHWLCMNNLSAFLENVPSNPCVIERKAKQQIRRIVDLLVGHKLLKQKSCLILREQIVVLVVGKELPQDFTV
jgi:hypothetical protein